MDQIDRHVALTASLYMSRDGLRCWPSQDTLAVRTGLTDRTVGRALKRLVDEKWLDRQPRKSPRDNRHPRYGFEYSARFPTRLANAYANGERGSLFSGKDPRPEVHRRQAPAPRIVNTERHDTRIPNGVRTNSVVELVKPNASNKGFGVSAQDIADMEAAFAAGGR